MKKLIVLASLALGAGVLLVGQLGADGESVAVATASAQGAEGCSPVGSWYGYYAPPTTPTWMATFSGRSNSSGTLILDYWDFDPTLGGTFPAAVKSTTGRGVWERKGGNMFATTGLAYGLDAEGHSIYIVKSHGTDTLSEDCSVVTVEITTDIFLANQNPFADTPLASIPQAPHNGYRIKVDPQ